MNRLIRVSFGPFQLGELADGTVEEVPRRVLRAQLGDRLAGEAGADLDAREEDRTPIQSVLAKAGKTGPTSRDKQPVARERAQSRPKGVSAAASRKRHEADLDAAQGRQPTGRSTGKTGTGKPPVRVAKAEKPQRATLTLKGEAKDGRRDGRLSRRTEAEDAPRAYKSGKSFDIDRKPRAHGDEPARVRGDRPQRGITPKGSRIQDGSPMSAPGGKGAKGGRGPKDGGGRGGPGKPRGRDADRRR